MSWAKIFPSAIFQQRGIKTSGSGFIEKSFYGTIAKS